MKRVALVLFGLSFAAALAAGCSPPCSDFSGPPSELCSPSGAAWEADKAYALTARNYFGAGGGTLTRCTVAIDAGVISLTVEGNSCRGNETLPVVTPSTVTCAMPAVPAGTYTIGTLRGPVTVAVSPGPSDAGSQLTPCGP